MIVTENLSADHTPLRLWDYGDVAAHTGMTERTVRRWVSEGRGPAPVRLGRTVRFRVADVVAWVDKQVAEQAA